MKETESNDILLALRREMLSSLRELGLSGSIPLFDESNDFYVSRFAKNGEPFRFIKKLRNFAHRLSLPEREILLRDGLEAPRYFQYWYIAQYTDKEHRQLRNKVINKVVEAFYS